MKLSGIGNLLVLSVQFVQVQFLGKEIYQSFERQMLWYTILSTDIILKSIKIKYHLNLKLIYEYNGSNIFYWVCLQHQQQWQWQQGAGEGDNEWDWAVLGHGQGHLVHCVLVRHLLPGVGGQVCSAAGGGEEGFQDHFSERWLF